MIPEDQLKIEATKNARLHFHPDYSKDAFTACEISFTKGYSLASSEIDESKKEIERLKALIEMEWHDAHAVNVTYNKDQRDLQLQLFKTQHNL